MRALFVGNISIQPARLEVALRLIRVGRDRGPCGCYLGGFARKTRGTSRSMSPVSTVRSYGLRKISPACVDTERSAMSLI